MPISGNLFLFSGKVQIVIIITLLIWEFFHWRLSDRKSPQFSRTILSILAALNNVGVLRVSTCSLISMFSSPFTNPLVTVLSTPIIVCITVIFMFNSLFFVLFFQFSRKVLVLISLFAFLQFYLVVSLNRKVYYSADSLFLLLLIITRSCRLAEITWSICISKFQRILYVSFSRTDPELYIYHFFLHNSKWITFPTQSWLALYFLFATLLLFPYYVCDSFVLVTT